MPDIFDQLHAEQGTDTPPPPSGGDIFDQIHAMPRVAPRGFVGPLPVGTKSQDEATAEQFPSGYAPPSNIPQVGRQMPSPTPTAFNPIGAGRNFSQGVAGMGNALMDAAKTGQEVVQKHPSLELLGPAAPMVIGLGSQIPAMGTQQNQIGADTVQAAKEGRYLDAARHGIGYVANAAAPGLGGMLDEAGNQAEQGYVSEGVGTAGAVAAAAMAPKIAEGAAHVVTPIIRGTERVATEALGKTTGSGATSVRRALERPTPELMEQMRNPDPVELLTDSRGALQKMADQRSLDYQRRMAQLPGWDTTQLDHQPVKDTLDTYLQKFNVVETPKGLDFSRSTLSDPAAQTTVKALYDDITGWGSRPGDLTPKGLDTLKRRLDNLYTPNGDARAMVQAVKDSTRNVVNQVPGYQEMTQGYSVATNLIDQIDRDLSLSSKNPGTAVRKLSTALNQNNEYRELIVDELNKYAGKDLTGALAGYHLSKWGPRGLMGPASGAGLIAAISTHVLSPQAALASAMASPRLMGELMAFLNKFRPEGLGVTDNPGGKLPVRQTKSAPPGGVPPAPGTTPPQGPPPAPPSGTFQAYGLGGKPAAAPPPAPTQSFLQHTPGVTPMPTVGLPETPPPPSPQSYTLESPRGPVPAPSGTLPPPQPPPAPQQFGLESPRGPVPQGPGTGAPSVNEPLELSSQISRPLGNVMPPAADDVVPPAPGVTPMPWDKPAEQPAAPPPVSSPAQQIPRATMTPEQLKADIIQKAQAAGVSPEVTQQWLDSVGLSAKPAQQAASPEPPYQSNWRGKINPYKKDGMKTNIRQTQPKPAPVEAPPPLQEVGPGQFIAADLNYDANAPNEPAGQPAIMPPQETPNAGQQPAAANAEPLAGVSAPSGGISTESSRIPPTRPASSPVAYGKATKVQVTGVAKPLDAVYSVREANDVQGSHNEQTFEPNPNFQHVNERQYNTPESRQAIIDRAKQPDPTGDRQEYWKPEYHVNTNPDAINGPPTGDENGNVLAGSNRTATLKRVYQTNPEGAVAYRQMLIDHAQEFGLDPQQVANMRRPVLYREITSKLEPQDYERLISDFNKPATATLTPAEQSMADSKRLSPDTLDFISRKIEEAGEGGTLATVLKKQGGIDILNRLVGDGVINRVDIRKYINDRDVLTDEGKLRIGNMLSGRMFEDAGQIERTDPSVRDKIERMVAPLTRLGEAEPEWDIAPQVKSAMGVIESAKQHSITLDDLAQQASFDPAKHIPDDVLRLAKHLKGTAPTVLSRMLQEYAQHASNARVLPQSDMFGNTGLQPLSREQAFQSAFEPWTRPLADYAAPEKAALDAADKQLAENKNSTPVVRKQLQDVIDKAANEYRKTRNEHLKLVRKAIENKEQVPEQVKEDYKTDLQKPGELEMALGGVVSSPIQPMASGGVVAKKSSPVLSETELVRGSSDVPLSAKGTQDTVELAKQFAKKGGLNRITAGSLARTQQTAQILKNYNPKVSVGLSGALQAWHLGGLEGRPKQHVVRQIENYIRHKQDVVPPGMASTSTAPGESYRRFGQRLMSVVRPAMSDFLQHPNAIDALVVHRSVISWLHGWLKKGMPADGSADAGTVLADRPHEGAYRFAPGKGGQWTVQHVDMKQAGRNKPGLYFIPHGDTQWNNKKDSFTKGQSSAA